MRLLWLPLISASGWEIYDTRDYCGKEDIPPYPGLHSSAKPVNIHVLFRHGMRTDYEKHKCFRDAEQTKYACSMDTDVGVSFGSTEISKRLVKKFKNGCEIGQLTDYASVQMNRLAQFLTGAYSHILTSERELYLRSTDKSRTLASLDLLLENLFRDRTRSLEVVTDEFGEDALSLSFNGCDRVNELETKFTKSQPFADITTSSAYYQECSRMWTAELGTEFNLAQAGDCLFSPMCAGVPFPKNLVPSKELLACVSNVYSAVRQLKYGHDDRWEGKTFCQLATAPILIELMTSAVKAGKSSFWATHDDSLACLLSAMGMWDGGWPKYAAFVVLEEYPDGHIRVIRDGQEVGQRESWTALIPSPARSADNFKHACEVSRPQPSAYADMLLRGVGVSALLSIFKTI